MPLATFINGLISDGIVAKGFTDEALALLKEKKKGSFVVIQCEDTNLSKPVLEFRDIGSGSKKEVPTKMLADLFRLYFGANVQCCSNWKERAALQCPNGE